MKRKFFILRMQDAYKAMSLAKKLTIYAVIIGLSTLTTFINQGDTLFVFGLITLFFISIHLLLETPKNLVITLLLGAQFFIMFVVAILYYNALVINPAVFDPSLYQYALMMLIVTSIALTMAAFKYSKGSIFITLLLTYLAMDFAGLGIIMLTGINNMFIPFLTGLAVILIRALAFSKDKDYIISEKPISKDLIGLPQTRTAKVENIINLAKKFDSLKINEYKDHECIDFTFKLNTGEVYPVTVLQPLEDILVSGENNVIFKGENINNSLSKIQYRGKQLIEDKEKSPYVKSIIVNVNDKTDAAYAINIKSKRYHRTKSEEILLMSPEAFLKLAVSLNKQN